MNDLAPNYLWNYINLYDNEIYNTRQRSGNILMLPPCKTSSYKKSFILEEAYYGIV